MGGVCLPQPSQAVSSNIPVVCVISSCVHVLLGVIVMVLVKNSRGRQRGYKLYVSLDRESSNSVDVFE